jgi:hypothetical protein
MMEGMRASMVEEMERKRSFLCLAATKLFKSVLQRTREEMRRSRREKDVMSP